MNKKICPICRYVDDNGGTYCRECGARMVEESAEGAGGGYSYQSDAYGPSYQQTGQTRQAGAVNGFQVASLVCGILSICSCCCYGITSLILGVFGVIFAGKGNQMGKNGVGTAGFVCSIIGIILGVIGGIYCAWFFFSFSRSGDWEYFMRQFMDRL